MSEMNKETGIYTETEEEKRDWEERRAVYARMMEIAVGISNGKTPEELGISGEWEQSGYNSIKEEYDRAVANGVRTVWAPVCGGYYDDW